MTDALWIWAITLAVVTVVIVPLAVYLLHRTLRAARSIERYTRESLAAGVGIATNTAAIAVLEPAGTWHELAPGQARLTAFVTPHDLPTA